MEMQRAAGGWSYAPFNALVCGSHLSPPEARPPTSGGVMGIASLRSLPGGSQKPLFGSYLRRVHWALGSGPGLVRVPVLLELGESARTSAPGSRQN